MKAIELLNWLEKAPHLHRGKYWKVTSDLGNSFSGMSYANGIIPTGTIIYINRGLLYAYHREQTLDVYVNGLCEIEEIFPVKVNFEEALNILSNNTKVIHVISNKRNYFLKMIADKSIDVYKTLFDENTTLNYIKEINDVKK